MLARRRRADKTASNNVAALGDLELGSRERPRITQGDRGEADGGAALTSSPPVGCENGPRSLCRVRTSAIPRG
jgi:hypothetical protein